MLGRNELAYTTAVNEYEATNREDPFELDDLADYAGATILDIGVSVANSLAWTVSGIATLGQGATDFGLDTGELLHAFNEDAGRFYDQNKDLVQLSSFVGGLFVPGIAAAKTMKWARNGRTWIGKAEKAIQHNEAKALDALADISKFDKQYRAARKSMRLHTVGQGIAEGAVYELEFAAMMNKHVYMDNEYDVVDFAIGAGLGALAGPIRLMQQSSKFRKKELAAVSEQLGQGRVSVPIDIQGYNAGDTLGNRGYQYNNWTNDDLTGASSGVQEFHKIAGWQHINDQTKLIYNMSLDDGLKGRINVTVPKGSKPIPRTYDYSDPFYATPDEIIGRMNINNPDTFPGVLNFRSYDSENPMMGLIDNLLIQADDGAIDIVSGALAREALVGAHMGRKPRQVSAIMNSLPANIEVKIVDGIETIHMLDKATKESKQWIADYLALDSIAQRPVRFTGATEGFKINKAALGREGVLRELDALGDKFVPYEDALDAISELPSRASILDPHFDGYMLSEIQAKTAASASATPKVRDAINTRAHFSTIREFSPYVETVAKTDASYLEAQYAWINSTKAGEIILNKNTAIPDIQAILNGTGTGTFPKVTIKDGPTLATRSAADEFLWAAKQDLVAEGLAAGASPIQIAKVTNLGIDTVDTIIAARGTKLPFDAKLPTAMYRKNDPAQYLSQVPIQAEGKLGHYGKIEEMKISSMHDAATLDDMHQGIMSSIIEKTQIPGGELQAFADDVLFGPVSKAIKDQLPRALAAIENRWNLFTSADHAMRELGPIGEQVVAFGKKMLIHPNNHIKRIKEALTPSISAVALDDASRTQFAMFRQALHAIPIEQATKLQYDAATGKIITELADDGTAAAYMKFFDTEQDIIFTPQMQSWAKAWLPVQDELLALHNANRAIHGLPASKGAGFWLPYSELHKEFVAYIIPNAKNSNRQVRLLSGRNADDLAEQVEEARGLYGHTHEVITKEIDSAHWNNLNRYNELEKFQVADISMRKTGITTGTVTPGITAIDNLFSSIQGDIWTKYRRIARAANSSIHNQLDFYAQRDLARTGGGEGFLAQKVQQKVSTPGLVSATMLNQSMVHDYPMLDMANNWTTVTINTVFAKAHEAWNLVRGKSKNIEEQYAGLTQALADANIPMPWVDTDAYQAALKRARVDDVALHRIQQSQSVLVMLNLRLMEASHATVTVASLPVILQGELAHMGESFPLKHMMDAGQFWAGKSDEVIALRKIAEANRYTESIVAETTSMMQDFHTKTNIFGKYQGLLDKLSTPSDWAEGFVREQAFANGYLLAKAKDPTAAMETLAASAYAFTSRTMGNYVPRQRPTMFQGTFGAMIGLYQTFMLTMGQNMFRYLEAGDAKAMANLWMGQAGMFGLESLPFFQSFNQLVGGRYSDDHEDIRTSIYQVFGEDTDQSRSAAEFMLFGLPSAAFGAGVYSRGTLDPRAPFSLTGQAGVSFKPAIFDAATQVGNLVVNLATGVAGAQNAPDLGKAIVQGFAAQSLWRPGARFAEIGMGQSFDQKGEIVSTEAEINEPFALFSRAIGARPLKEQALRNLRFSNSYYNTVDDDKKSRVTKRLRRVLTTTHGNEDITMLYNDYIKNGGTYKGWRQIYNKAYMSVDTPYADRMLDGIHKQPAIQDIVDTYAN